MTPDEAVRRAHELLGPSACNPHPAFRHKALCVRLQANELEHARTVSDLREEIAQLRSEPDMVAEAERKLAAIEKRAEKDLGAAVWLFLAGLEVTFNWAAFEQGKDVAPVYSSAGWERRVRAFLEELKK